MTVGHADRGIDHVARSETIRVITRRRNGADVVTEILGVVVGRAVYIRDGYGSKWYLRALRAGEILLIDGEVRYRATVERVENTDILAKIDRAYMKKYGSDPAVIEQAVSEEGRRHTLRVNLVGVNSS
jgi:hypothetical protein